jgi:hypothetical protein
MLTAKSIPAVNHAVIPVRPSTYRPHRLVKTTFKSPSPD